MANPLSAEKLRHFESLAERSINEQRAIEAADSESLDDYLARYMAAPSIGRVNFWRIARCRSPDRGLRKTRSASSVGFLGDFVSKAPFRLIPERDPDRNPVAPAHRRVQRGTGRHQGQRRTASATARRLAPVFIDLVADHFWRVISKLFTEGRSRTSRREPMQSWASTKRTFRSTLRASFASCVITICSDVTSTSIRSNGHSAASQNACDG